MFVPSRAASNPPVPSPLYPEYSVLLAPLSGYTDYPFRALCRAYGCRYAFTPLIAARSIIHRNPRNPRLLFRGRDEPWLGVQLEGDSPEIFAEAAERLNEYDFNVLDLNMGCPVPKIMKKNAGAALLADPDRAAACVQAAARASRFPVTAKIRILDARAPGPTVRFAKRLEEAGIRALTIHGRIAERFYSGPVFFEGIRAVRQALGIPVIANGGIMDAESARMLREETGCSRIMVARGAIGNPWIFREIPAGAPGGAARSGHNQPEHRELCDVLERHVSMLLHFYGETIGILNARKIILAYLTGRGYRRVRRRQAGELRTEQEFRDFMAVLRREGVSPRFHGK